VIVFGIDIGTTTLRATAVEMKASPLGRSDVKALGQPLCVLTPYEGGRLLEESILTELNEWAATLPPPDLGTLLFTGEAQRAANASAIAESLTTLWPGLFSAQLDPDHETRVAAHGAHAVTLSANRVGSPVIHFDVGGGTTNVAWIENGEIRDTCCLDLGARKWICNSSSRKLIRRTAQAEWIERSLGIPPPQRMTAELANKLGNAIADRIYEFSKTDPRFIVVPWKKPRLITDAKVLSFSGGVVECLGMNDFSLGDIGPWLGKALIEKARIMRKEIHVSSEAGRATAFGVSAHGFQLSGNSLFHSDGSALSNIPVYEESEVTAKGFKPPPKLAVAVRHLTTDNLLDTSSRWTAWIKKHSPESCVFLMKANLGKSLGYLMSKAVTRVALYLLDEIDPPEATAVSIRPTVDVRPTPEGERFSVVIKQLRLF